MPSEHRKAQMRRYSVARYHRMKAQGTGYKEKGRNKGKYGQPIRNFIREYIKQRKIDAGKCVLCEMPCEEWNHVMFAWDHIDRRLKTINLSQAIKLPIDIAIDTINQELDNCQLMCHNCHHYKTWIERDHDQIDKPDKIQPPSLFDDFNQ